MVPLTILSVPWGDYWQNLAQGLLVTVEYTLAGFAGAVVLGIILAMLRVWGGRPLAILARAVVEIFKNLPLITEIFIIYFGLSSVGINLSAFLAGCLALIGHYGAYLSEIFRSGIQAVDPGQREAGMALGMTTWGAFRKVLVPQAVLVALPGTGTMLVDLLKGTSLMVTIGGAELMTQGQIVTSATFRALEVYLVIGAIYFALCFPLSSLMVLLEKRLAAGLPFSPRRLKLLGNARQTVARLGSVGQATTAVAK